MDENLETNENVREFARLFIIEGKEIIDFINKTVLKGAHPICQLTTQKTAIYDFPKQGYVICVTEGNDFNTTGQITELLRPWLEKANETIAITVQPAYTYLSQKQFDRRCFVRAISKGSAPDSKRLDYVEPLEDCNMVQGISAGGKPLILHN